MYPEKEIAENFVTQLWMFCVVELFVTMMEGYIVRTFLQFLELEIVFTLTYLLDVSSHQHRCEFEDTSVDL